MRHQATVPSSEVTHLLAAWRGGDRGALDRLMPLLFEELRRLSRHRLAQEAAGHTLQPTALIHEAYLRLAGRPLSGIENRRQFFAVASRLMRQILVDHARTKYAAKRGGREEKGDWEDAVRITDRWDADSETLLDVHRALNRLESLDPRPARVVELKFFCGMTLRETAEVLGTSLATVERDWSFARRWLAKELRR